MAQQIGLRDIRFVGNKIAGSSDDRYILEALADTPPIAMIPHSELIRTADRNFRSVLDCCEDAIKAALTALLRRARKQHWNNFRLCNYLRKERMSIQPRIPGDRDRQSSPRRSCQGR